MVPGVRLPVFKSIYSLYQPGNLKLLNFSEPVTPVNKIKVAESCEDSAMQCWEF